MNKHIWSRFAVITATFVINGILLAGVNYLFSGEMRQDSAGASRAALSSGARYS
jgi:hypothetical protein